MGKRGPLSATDRRRQAGHKHPRSVRQDDDTTGASARLAPLYNDRRNGSGQSKTLGKGKRAS